MSESANEQPILSDWLKKKGSKFGFWHKRYVVLTETQMIVSKTKSTDNPERVIDIDVNTEITLLNDIDPPRFIVKPPNERQICLGNSNLDVILNWTNQLRNATLRHEPLSMDSFEIVSVLGRGFYGKVMLCRNKRTNEMCAIKTVHKNRLIKANKVHTIFTERNVLLKARHPFIVNILFAFQTDAKVYLGLEYASGGELFYHLSNRGTIPLSETRLYVAQLCLAINYLHSLGVVYRDLKPENVLLDENGYVKLTDFGLSKNLDLDSTTATFCGTSEYLAPEIIARKSYGQKIDWWAIGILCYELLYGETPFYHENKSKLFQAIRNSEPRFPKKAPQSTISFIRCLLEKNPDDRADFDQIKDHPFFENLNWDDVQNRKFTPAFKPPKSTRDAKNFDTEFTMENPQDSIATPAPNADAFNGFSYVAGDDPKIDNNNQILAPPPSDVKPTTM